METSTEKPQNKMLMYRFEKKFALHQTQLSSFLMQLNLAGYKRIYEDRFINNLYLDDIHLKALKENIEGLSERKKVRIRWYGHQFALSKKQLEEKIKKDDVNTKNILQLENTKLISTEKTASFYRSISNELKEKHQNTYYQKGYYKLIPTLLNRYLRSYYYNHDKQVRLTIDRSLSYYSCNLKTLAQENHIIVELKSSAQNIITDHFFKSFELTKFSKYVKGMIATGEHKPEY